MSGPSTKSSPDHLEVNIPNEWTKWSRNASQTLKLRGTPQKGFRVRYFVLQENWEPALRWLDTFREKILWIQFPALPWLRGALKPLTKIPIPQTGFPVGSDRKEYACDVGDPGLIPGWGRSTGEGNGNPRQLPGKSHGQRILSGYSPWDRKKSDVTEWLSLSFLENGSNSTKVYAWSHTPPSPKSHLDWPPLTSLEQFSEFSERLSPSCNPQITILIWAQINVSLS